MKNIIEVSTGEVIEIVDDDFFYLLNNGIIFFSTKEKEYFFYTIFKEEIMDIIHRSSIKKFNNFFK